MLDQTWLEVKLKLWMLEWDVECLEYIRKLNQQDSKLLETIIACRLYGMLYSMCFACMSTFNPLESP